MGNANLTFTNILSKYFFYSDYAFASLLAQMVKICLQCRRPGFTPWVRRIPWRREGLPTPVFLSGEFHGERSLANCSPVGSAKSWTGLSDGHFHFYAFHYAFVCNSLAQKENPHHRHHLAPPPQTCFSWQNSLITMGLPGGIKRIIFLFPPQRAA